MTMPPVVPSLYPAVSPRLRLRGAVALACLALSTGARAQQAPAADLAGAGADNAAPLDTIQVSGSWLGTGLQNSLKRYAGARTVVQKEDIEDSGAASIGDVMRRIPGVQVSDNSGSAGSAVSLNIGVRGLAGRYSPRSTVLLDGIPLAVAPYGQPQLSFAPVSLNNIESVDVVRGGGAVRYGPQNVGGIINFTTRAIPDTPGLTGDASIRYNDYQGGGNNRQYSAFLGTQLDTGLGIAVLYSGLDGAEWRQGSDEHANDFAFKFRYAFGADAELYGKLSYYDVKSRTPGGLTTAQYAADPLQNTRPTDFWSGDRRGGDIGYRKTISATQEIELRTYYNESFRQSVLISGATLGHQPRHYQVLGIEPRYTQRFSLLGTTQDVTVGYRFLRERADESVYNQVLATGALQPVTSFFYNTTDAHAFYIDDRIALGNWRITPGIRYENIGMARLNQLNGQDFELTNNKALPSLNVAYLATRDLTLFTNYGTSFGEVQNTQLNSQTAANPLQPELAKTVELGVRLKRSGLSAEATLFHIRFDNQIQQVGSGLNPTFINVGETRHEGLETAVDYSFDKGGSLAGLNLFANYTHTRATLQSGDNIGNDVPFYSRDTDTLGARYTLGRWAFNLSSTHQSRQFADNANTVAENAAGDNGVIPGFRVWNAQLTWKPPGLQGLEIVAGANNFTDKQYFTRTTDGNRGKLGGAPRLTYLQGRYAF